MGENSVQKIEGPRITLQPSDFFVNSNDMIAIVDVGVNFRRQIGARS
jgi:hypothetical protein